MIIPIPPLVPRDSYTGHTTPVGTVTYPFVPEQFRAHGNAKPVSLNRWQPAESRPAIDVLRANVDVPRAHVDGWDYIVRFSSIAALSSPLPRAKQPHHRFSVIPPSSINMVQADGNALAWTEV